jgi:Tfp pilus assembly protein PilF
MPTEMQAEALKLYEKIALYSEAISQYNLGVVQLKEGEYKSALDNFKRSIANSENRCVSAINAAVCSLHLKREKDFNTYINMALLTISRRRAKFADVLVLLCFDQLLQTKLRRSAQCPQKSQNR